MRSLANRQDLYYNANDSYSDDPTALEFSSTDGVTVAFTEAHGLGWSASATHSALGTGKVCAIYHGRAEQLEPASVASTVQCRVAAAALQ